MFKRMLSIVILAATGTAFAADAPPTKTYTLSKLQKVDGSDATCKQLLTDLQAYAKKPVVIEFTSKGTSEFEAKHQENQLINHNYKIIQQAVSENAITRFGMGTFELDNKKLDYVITITADLKNPKTSYTYPMIIAQHASHCVFTAALKPDKNTIAAFKKHIENKNLDNGADLTSH